MGFPLRSNIFRTGTNEQEYFARFPIQVAVLFSPSDNHFREAFQDIFLQLDRLTGDQVAFFAVLDPPRDWLEDAKNRDWWRNYEARVGRSGFTVENRVLVREIARLFGVGWHYLPAIVVGTNLWTGEHIISGTSPFHLKKQLEVLTDLAHEWGRPNIEQIQLALSDIIGFEVEYYPPDEDLRYRLDRTYGFLDTTAHPNNFDQEKYKNLLQSEYHAMENSLRRVRRTPGDRERRFDEDQSADRIFEDASGRMVAPATVAMKAYRRLRNEVDTDLIETLEEEALVMAETSLTVGHFLEAMTHNELEGIQPFRLDRPGIARSIDHYPDSSVDFTPGAQGAWKAFELEINFSIIQAARAGRTIRMPEFFTRFDSAFPKGRSKVLTGTDSYGKDVYKDINQRDRETPRTGRHRFLTLGDAFYVTKALSESSTEDFNNVVTHCLGECLSPRIMDAWEIIYQLRNKASHTQPLHMNEYAIVLRSALAPEVLSCLARIKRRLSGR